MFLLSLLPKKPKPLPDEDSDDDDENVGETMTDEKKEDDKETTKQSTPADDKEKLEDKDVTLGMGKLSIENQESNQQTAVAI